jgi:SOS-response transcriptional repressor LexA
MREKGIGMTTLARISGISRTHIYGIMKGKRNPSVEILRKLAGALDVNVRDLLVPEPEIKDRKNQYRLPVFSQVVVGPPDRPRTPPLRHVDVTPDRWSKTRYVLKVFDNSMEPELKKGDLVLIDNDNSIKRQRNNIVACSVGEKKFLRRYLPQGVVSLLVAENPAYKAIAVTSSRRDFKIHGVAVELIHRRLR